MDINKPVAWMLVDKNWNDFCRYSSYPTNGAIPLYTHPAKTLSKVVLASATCSCGKVMEVTNLQEVKTLTDEDIVKVVHELKQKASTPDRWVTAMQIGAETIIQLRDELRKAQEK
jgi:hypothetical protein